MKLRRAAALALVGWYLMIAPARSIPEACLNGLVDEDLCRAYMTMPGLPLDTHAPLSTWTTIAGFDSATACAQARKKAIDAEAQQLANSTPANDLNTLELAIECIATDDPRLK
jgi:hypothetical protein